MIFDNVHCYISSDVEWSKHLINVTYSYYQIYFILWVGIKNFESILIELSLLGLILMLELLSI